MSGVVVTAFRRALAGFVLFYGVVGGLFVLLSISHGQGWFALLSVGKGAGITPSLIEALTPPASAWDVPVLTGVAVAGFVVAVLLHKRSADR